MAQFKVGDQVEFLRFKNSDWELGTIIEVDEDDPSQPYYRIQNFTAQRSIKWWFSGLGVRAPLTNNTVQPTTTTTYNKDREACSMSGQPGQDPRHGKELNNQYISLYRTKHCNICGSDKGCMCERNEVSQGVKYIKGHKFIPARQKHNLWDPE